MVLVVEDTPSMRALYCEQLAGEGVRIATADTLSGARAEISREPPAAVLLDVRLPDGDGIDLLREMRDAGCDAAVIVVTAHGSVNLAVAAMRAGADDFLVKPFAPTRMLTTLRNGLERRRLRQLVRNLSPTTIDGRFEGFIGDDLSMQAIYRMIDQAARSVATVFIGGESGTGKEVCAEAIHRRSPRRASPFIPVNCATLPRDLIESELFGHVKGAFTGANSDWDGAVLQADGGTLFLDEITEMDLALQAKLLRFLQTKTIQKVGSDHLQKVDVRVICASNRDPLRAVEEGRFREDLFYRLHVVPIVLPPLRDRGGDAVMIARGFLKEFSREEGRAFRGFTPEVEDIIRDHPWPGNVRQLQNVIRNVVVLHDGEAVTADMLPATLFGRRAPAMPSSGLAEPAPQPDDSADRGRIRTLVDIERDAIETAIDACGGNMTEAAHRLGINVSTIYRKRQAWAGDS